MSEESKAIESADGIELPLEAHVEAVLFTQDQPLPLTRIQSLFPDRTRREVEDALEALQQRHRETTSGIELREIAGGWQLFTRPEVDETLGRLTKAPGADKLSPAAIETLAIIAYRQPVIRADIEAVRGVQAGPLLRTLLEKRLIRIVGRSEVPGHPLLYGTAKRFLDHFGLRDLGELPKPEEIGEVAAEPPHEATREEREGHEEAAAIDGPPQDGAADAAAGGDGSSESPGGPPGDPPADPSGDRPTDPS